jgi:ribosomal protein S27AE
MITFKDTGEKIPEDQLNDTLPDLTPEEAEKTFTLKKKFCYKCQDETIMEIRQDTYTCTRCHVIYQIKDYEQMLRGYKTSEANAKIIEDIIRRHRARRGLFNDETDDELQDNHKKARDRGLGYTE